MITQIIKNRLHRLQKLLGASTVEYLIVMVALISLITYAATNILPDTVKSPTSPVRTLIERIKCAWGLGACAPKEKPPGTEPCDRTVYDCCRAYAVRMCAQHLTNCCDRMCTQYNGACINSGGEEPRYNCGWCDRSCLAQCSECSSLYGCQKCTGPGDSSWWDYLHGCQNGTEGP